MKKIQTSQISNPLTFPHREVFAVEGDRRKLVGLIT